MQIDHTSMISSASSHSNQEILPFLKWAGGKRWLTHSHKNIFPPSDSYNKYIEPFLGSGSIFLFKTSKIYSRGY